MNAFLRRLSWLARRHRKEEDLRAEVEFHLSEETEQRQADGLASDEARRAARRELGNVTRVEEDTRAAWGWTLLEQFIQDLRYAVRTMAANRLFTLLAASSLALGIGANTAIFSFMDAILMRALPVSDPESLVVLNWRARPWGNWRDFVMHGVSGNFFDDPKSGVIAGIFPYPAFELFRTHDEVFSTVFAHFQSYHAKTLNLTIKGQAGIASGVYVSGDYFRGLGVPPAAGRLLLPSDDRQGAPAVALISHALSQARFGNDANATGHAILIDNLPFTVVGVTPAEFFGVDPAAAPDVFMPMHANDQFRPEDYLDGTTIGPRSWAACVPV